MINRRKEFSKETKRASKPRTAGNLQVMTVEEHAAMTFSQMSDVSLLERAVRGARGRNYCEGEEHPRWVAVKETFALGSTFSKLLCRRFEMDPDEMVKR